jgi:hypothetical protein
MTEDQMKAEIASRYKGIMNQNADLHGDLLAQSAAAYEKRWHKKMSDGQRAALSQSFNRMTHTLINRDHIDRGAIMSAVSDISKVDNPITLLYNLMSILIPNFAYTEVIGIQPLPTKKAPIFYPQILANEDRNNVAKGSVLLGSTNWNESNNYSTNRVKNSVAVPASGTAVAFTAPEGNIRAGTVVITLNFAAFGTAYVFDDGEGKLVPVAGITGDPAGTVDYATGAVALTLAAEGVPATDTITVDYRYDFADDTKPAQAVLKWESDFIEAEPWRLRSTYDLDDFYQVKQVLSGYNIDNVLSTSLAGYINKEISGGVFDDLLIKTDANYAWNSANPTGVAWALHRLSLLQTFVRGSNGLRKNISRSPATYAICGTEWMNFIETLGDDVWAPQSYASGEPVGPYVAGKLLGKYTILKNQDYPDAKAVMGYKKDDTDASDIGGVFIGLYSTAPVALDDLKVIQGMGTQMGHKKIFDNSLLSLTVTNVADVLQVHSA